MSDIPRKGDLDVRIVDKITQTSAIVNDQGDVQSTITQRCITSVLNSSTANLNAGATFTGTAEIAYSISALQVLFKASQECTIYVDQSPDGLVGHWDIIDSYKVKADTGDARTFTSVAPYFRVRVTNDGALATTYLRLATGMTPILNVGPRSLSQNGNTATLSSGVSTGDYYPNGMPDPALNQGDENPMQLDGDGSMQIRGSILTDEGSFSDCFAGDTLDPAYTQVVGTGGSISVSNSNLVITSGTTANAETYIQIAMDYLPLLSGWRLSISQRIVNQDIYIGLFDGDTPVADEEYACLHFYGTDNTKVSAETRGHADPGGTEGIDTPILIPNFQNTSQLLYWVVSVIPERTAFNVGTNVDTLGTLALRYTDIPTAYKSLNLRIMIKNGAIAPTSSTTITCDKITVRNLNRVSIENPFTNDAAQTQLVGYDSAGQQNLKVGVDGAGNLKIVSKLPFGGTSLQLLSDASLTALNANQWQDVLTYTVPVGYDFNITNLQGYTASAGDILRSGYRVIFGTYVTSTNTFTDGAFVLAPTFLASMCLLVTTAIGSTANDTITITYLNQDNVSKVITYVLTKSTAAGNRYTVPLAAGDYGIRDITNVTHSQAGQAGAFTLEGYISLMYMTLDVATTFYNQTSNLGETVVPSGATLLMQYQSGSGVAKARRLCVVGVLAPR